LLDSLLQEFLFNFSYFCKIKGSEEMSQL